MTVSSPLTRATLRTLEKTTFARELTSTRDGPSRKGESKDKKSSHREKVMQLNDAFIDSIAWSFFYNLVMNM